MEQHERGSSAQSRELAYLKAAFLAMEPTDCVLSLARQSGGGSLTVEVQNFIMENCIKHMVSLQQVLSFKHLRDHLRLPTTPIDGARLLSLFHNLPSAALFHPLISYLLSLIGKVPLGSGILLVDIIHSQDYCGDAEIADLTEKRGSSNHDYSKNVIKKLISSAESSGEAVLEDLYETYAHYISPAKESFSLKDGTKNFRSISFFCSNGSDEGCSDTVNFVVPIQCSSNILEGDTGCSIWPSSLFLSEFVLSYPSIFHNKICLELGAGVGLVGIILNKVKASKVILTDGDLSTLENMQANLEINRLQSICEVECKHLLWESASEVEIVSYSPEIIVGADIIYDPLCLPHLIRILSLLLRPSRVHEDSEGKKDSLSTSEAPVAYFAAVIRNQSTLECFLRLASGADLEVVDLSETTQPLRLIPYMRSYDRAAVRLFKILFAQVS